MRLGRVAVTSWLAAPEHKVTAAQRIPTVQSYREDTATRLSVRLEGQPSVRRL